MTCVVERMVLLRVQELDEHVRKRGHEFGVTTGRPRRCGWFDAVMLQYANKINGFAAYVVQRM